MCSGFSYDASLKSEDLRRCAAIYVLASARNFVSFGPLERVISKLRDSFQGHVLYEICQTEGGLQHALSGVLHWTFMQLVGFSIFDKIDFPADYKEVIQMLLWERLREFEIRFTGLIATPSNLLLVGFPTLDCNSVREEIRDRLRLMGYPLYEPYKNDIFHMTLVRFAEPLSQAQQEALKRIAAGSHQFKDQTLAVLRVQQMCISNASWKMQYQELKNEKVVTADLLS